MTPDFNVLEQRASMFMEQGANSRALKIYLHMADGDSSLDAGYLGFRTDECYERLGDRHAAKYSNVRAIEENPAIELYSSARKRVQHVGIGHLMR